MPSFLYGRCRRALSKGPLLRLQHRLFLNRLKAASLAKGTCEKDDLPVDIVIPAIDRDLPTLPLVIDGVRRNIAHDVRTIYIVAPRTPVMQSFCSQVGCTFIDEATVLPISKSDIHLTPQGIDRSGWIFQQFLKLSADRISSSHFIIIVDADTVLLHPQLFIVDGMPVFRISDELYMPYFRQMRRLLKRRIRAYFSFVAHHMVFDRTHLAELRAEIERVAGYGPWHRVILDRLDPKESSGFSEYETYGRTFLATGRPAKLEYWHNIGLERKDMLSIEELENLYGETYRSASFHFYLSKTDKSVG
ncbi:MULTISPECIES: DUF6492 family protein [unclassified Sphingomonas]|jgi:Family of unknown function (DUF6492)|uniref:DUF6492 family protein n=1 Tax=unclassified Sphingomonas TaxID=196159 RepID=UPI000F73F38B|nr:DUF6492 family protein [Sphingomonas sp. FARSPH]